MNLSDDVKNVIVKCKEVYEVCKEVVERLSRPKEREVTENREILLPSNSPPTRRKKSVDLCLVVPASVVENVRKNYPIYVSDIERLIDNSLYFLCTTPEDANATQQRLELTEEDITTVSEQREIYVRINIDNGEEMRDKRVPYILKRNLPSNGQGTVKKLAFLEYLSVSGLEKFNRI